MQFNPIKYSNDFNAGHYPSSPTTSNVYAPGSATAHDAAAEWIEAPSADAQHSSQLLCFVEGGATSTVIATTWILLDEGGAHPAYTSLGSITYDTVGVYKGPVVPPGAKVFFQLTNSANSPTSYRLGFRPTGQ